MKTALNAIIADSVGGNIASSPPICAVQRILQPALYLTLANSQTALKSPHLPPTIKHHRPSLHQLLLQSLHHC